MEDFFKSLQVSHRHVKFPHVPVFESYGLLVLCFYFFLQRVTCLHEEGELELVSGSICNSGGF
jgi:hypothetical protein